MSSIQVGKPEFLTSLAAWRPQNPPVPRDVEMDLVCAEWSQCGNLLLSCSPARSVPEIEPAGIARGAQVIHSQAVGGPLGSQPGGQVTARAAVYRADGDVP